MLRSKKRLTHNNAKSKIRRAKITYSANFIVMISFMELSGSQLV